jgi:hypothetical protein
MGKSKKIARGTCEEAMFLKKSKKRDEKTLT